MPESESHRRAKNTAAGPSGSTEVPLRGGGRLDAQTPTKAVEIERSGDPQRLADAAARLKASGKPQKVLQVLDPYFDKGVTAMKETGVSGTVKNMGGTKSRHIPKRR